jgi:hypothetical protein
MPHPLVSAWMAVGLRADPALPPEDAAERGV